MTGVPSTSAALRAAASARTASRFPALGRPSPACSPSRGESVPLGDWRFWLMAALVLVGELMPIDVPRRDGVDRVAISTAFAFAILLSSGCCRRSLAYAAASAIADVHARLPP